MHILLYTLFLMFNATLLLQGAKFAELTVANETFNREAAVRNIAAATSNYRLETGSYPASLTALTTAAGHEYLKSDDKPFQAYALSNVIDDGMWRYRRATVYTQDPWAPDPNYLLSSNNTCGTGDFTSSVDWCGSKNSLWWKGETRENAQQESARERDRQRRLMNKIVLVYNKNGVFPNPGSAAVSLTSLIASPPASAAACNGVWNWNGIPLDCLDLYSIWGTPTVYNYLTTTHIALLVASPYQMTGGATFYVNTDMSL
jgi:hypothetical protein